MPDLAEDVVEVPLLLPAWQMTALETAAHSQGLTAAAMVRHVLGDFIRGLPTTSELAAHDGQDRLVARRRVR
jgi:hypothetical protein